MENKLTDDEILETLARTLDWRVSNLAEEAWVILFKGQRLQLRSGKSIWVKKRFAVLALTNDLRYAFWRSGIKPKKAIELGIQAGYIEFVNLNKDVDNIHN